MTRTEKTALPKAIKTNSGYEVEVWNRKYAFGLNPFLQAIVSDGEELLSSPMRIVGIENGKELVWRDIENFLMDINEDGQIRLAQAMQSERFILNTNVTIEEDGCMDWRLTLISRGMTVNQVFGLEEEDKGDRVLSRLWLEIPLKKQAAEFYHVLPFGDIVLDGRNTSDSGALAQAGAVPERSIELPFKQQVYLGNDNVGFGIFFESDKYWRPIDENKAIECVVEKDEVLLRVHFLDNEAFAWLDKGRGNGMNSLPLTFRIGMIATPVKPFPTNPYTQKNVHIDCFKKIPQNYEEYLFEKLGEENGNMLDRMQRLGVDTLYIHEKWNDIQNSPELTTNSANRLKLIVKEAHKRGIKVVPYFGYEISTLAPVFGERFEEYMGFNGERWHWYRTPWQRDVLACYQSSWQEYFLEHVETIFRVYDIDGIYIDSIMTIAPCKNEKHGCGYRDHNGELKATYPVWRIREFMKKLHKIAEKYNGFVASHSYGAFSLPTLAYSDMLWEGESIQSLMLTGKVDSIPIDYLRAIYSGRNLGITINMLCYSNPPVWTFRQATALALPFGIIPKPNDAEEPLEEMRGVWSAIDAFPIEESTWRPYFKNSVETDNPNVKASYFETEDKALFFISNMQKSPTGKVEIRLHKPYRKVCDAVSLQELSVAGNILEVSFETLDYVIIRAEK